MPSAYIAVLYGIDFPTKKELIASSHSVEWIRKFIGLNTLKYLSLEGMLKNMPLPKSEFCTACFTGRYPLKPANRLSKNILEKKRI